jgi:hypothetical protein
VLDVVDATSMPPVGDIQDNIALEAARFVLGDIDANDQ